MFGPILELFGSLISFGRRRREDDELVIAQEKRKEAESKLEISHQHNADLQARLHEIEEQLAKQKADSDKAKLESEIDFWKGKASEAQTLSEKRRKAGKRLLDQRDIALQTVQCLEQQLEEKLKEQDAEWQQRLEEKSSETDRAIQRYQRRAEDLTDKLESASDANLELRAEVAHFKKKEKKILSREGRIWERTIPENAPPFVSAEKRTATIISVLNLKGGVGKTTLTANLAATLGHPDNDVPTLVIDLDYQRTLSQLCCTKKQQKNLHLHQQCAQHFFLHPDPELSSFDVQNVLAPASLSELLHRNAAEVRRKKRELFKIIAASENMDSDHISNTLDDTEMHLFAEWLLEEGESDIRFHLRKALHHNPVASSFDYIFLDCPPRLSLACINALLASDFVLIPVIPDEVSKRSIALLLQKLERMRTISGILSNLKILGVVANKVHPSQGQLIKHQQTVWDNIPLSCKIQSIHAPNQKESIYRFETKIPQSSAFGDAAAEREDDVDFASSTNVNIREIFNSLISEIEERINYESSRPPTVSPEPHSSTVGRSGST